MLLEEGDTIRGKTGVFRCPDLATVDAHLTKVRRTLRNLKQSGKYPKLIPRYRADLDALLDRRIWLQMTQPAKEATE
jgi:hypothetical protein